MPTSVLIRACVDFLQPPYSTDFARKRSTNAYYEGHSEIIDTLLPQLKRKIYSSIWDSIIFKFLLWWLNPSSARLNQDRKEGKELDFWKELQRRPYIIINFPSSQIWHSLCALSQFWEQERLAGG